MLKKMTASVGYSTAALTTIGRTGMVFLGITTAIPQIFNVSPTVTYIAAGIGSSAIIISYGSVFTEKVHELIGKVFGFDETEQQNTENTQEGSKNYSTGTKIVDVAAYSVGWVLGFGTSAVEGMVTLVGWKTWLDTFGISPVLSSSVSTALGIASVLGWLGLVGLPTSKVFHRIITGMLSCCIQPKQQNSDFFDIRYPFVWGAGITISMVSAIGSGSIGFLATQDVVNTFAANSHLLFLELTAAGVTFLSTGALYVLVIPKSFQDMYAGVKNIFCCEKPLALPSYARKAQQAQFCLKNLITKPIGTATVSLTGTSTYLLGFIAIANLIKTIAPENIAHYNTAFAHILGIGLGIGAAAISGRSGFSFVNNPLGFFNRINQRYRNTSHSETNLLTDSINVVKYGTYH